MEVNTHCVPVDHKKEINIKTKTVLPIGSCDFCLKYFYEGDNRIVQTSNHCSDLFKLEFCSINCLQNVEKDYEIVRLCEFENQTEKIDEDENDDENENLMNILITNFVEFVIDIENRRPFKSYEIMDNYIKLYQKKQDELSKHEKNYLEFIRDNNIFNLF